MLLNVLITRSNVKVTKGSNMDISAVLEKVRVMVTLFYLVLMVSLSCSFISCNLCQFEPNEILSPEISAPGEVVPDEFLGIRIETTTGAYSLNTAPSFECTSSRILQVLSKYILHIFFSEKLHIFFWCHFWGCHYFLHFPSFNLWRFWINTKFSRIQKYENKY